MSLADYFAQHFVDLCKLNFSRMGDTLWRKWKITSKTLFTTLKPLCNWIWVDVCSEILINTNTIYYNPLNECHSEVNILFKVDVTSASSHIQGKPSPVLPPCFPAACETRRKCHCRKSTNDCRLPVRTRLNSREVAQKSVAGRTWGRVESNPWNNWSLLQKRHSFLFRLVGM